jgi:hypothetical protein
MLRITAPRCNVVSDEDSTLFGGVIHLELEMKRTPTLSTPA